MVAETEITFTPAPPVAAGGADARLVEIEAMEQQWRLDEDDEADWWKGE